MQINRQNYEQYFLLYADGELTTSQRNAVQEFVAVNKDLAIELAMIQAAILPAEEVMLLDKNFLFKGIDEQTQEKLLLKIDNELPAKELAAINAVIQNDSAVKATFDLFSKTVLDKNEKIIFEHKHLLYKKEKDNVVVFGYLRWAAAAVFIGIALFTGIKFYSNKSTVEPAVANANKENATQKNTLIKTENNSNTNNKTDNNTSNVAQANETTIEPNKNNANNTNNIITNSTENKLANETQKNVNNKNIVTNNSKERITNKQQENIENKSPNNFIPNQEEAIAATNTNTKNENNNTTAISNSTQKIINTERVYELENTYAYQNVVQRIEDNTENKILYMNESKVKKSKVGIFFSKIKAAVQKTAKVKPGQTIQVAGFEISGN